MSKDLSSALLILLLLLLPATAHAQAGYYVTAGLGVGGEWDDNIFAAPSNIDTTPGRESDYIGYARPSVGVGYLSAPFTLLAGYSTTARAYANRSELNNAFDAQSATVSSLYNRPRFSLTANGAYFESHNTNNFNQPRLAPAVGTPPSAVPPQTTAQPAFGDVSTPVTPTTVETTTLNAHARTQAYTASSSATYEFTPLTDGTVHAGYVYTDQVGGTSNQAVSAGSILSHTISPIDSARLSYGFHAFGFGSQNVGQGSGNTSHTVTVGYSRKLTERLSMSLDAGPRFSSGNVNAEASANFGYLLQNGGANFGYSRTQSLVVGERGVFTTDSFRLGLSQRLGQFLAVSLGASATRAESDTRENWVYRAFLGTGYPLADWVSATLTYEFSFSNQGPSMGSAREKIYRNIVSIGLATGTVYRIL